MINKFKDTIVVSIGGSLLIPDSIDINFIKKLKEIIANLVENNYQIALVIGGGKTARIYQGVASMFSNVKHVDLDWIGIKAIRLNCELILRIFSDLNIHENVIESWDKARNIKENVIVVGAFEPGCSSDKDAVELSIILNGKSVINLSNISHVYDSDPNKNTDAKKIKDISWNDYLDLIPDKWSPGLSSPFDPIASRRARDNEISVIVMGTSLENFKNYLDGNNFEGTTIS